MKRNLLAALCVALLGVSSVVADDCCEPTCGAANCCDTGCDTGCSDCGGEGCGACEDTCDDCCEDDCCEEVCDDCCDDCCECCVPGLVAGAEGTFLRPDFDGDSFLFDFGDFEAAPRIWAGYENCGRGFRARYWQLGADDRGDLNFSDIAEDDDFIQLRIDGEASLDVYAGDLEVTRRGEMGNWEMLATLGVRHANLDRENNFSAFFNADIQGIPGGDISAFLDADLSREFQGTGITGALEGRRRLGNGNFSFVWNARGSYLWGDVTTSGNLFLDVSFIDGPGIEIPFSFEEDQNVFIGEAQVGLEWSRPVDAIEGHVFARTMVEYQTWDIDNSDIGIDLIDSALGATDMDLYGATFAVGFER